MEGLHWIGDTAFSCIVYEDRFFGLGKGESASEREPESLSCEGVGDWDMSLMVLTTRENLKLLRSGIDKVSKNAACVIEVSCDWCK